MSDIKQLANIPEISFIENMTLEETVNFAMDQYKNCYKKAYGKDPELRTGDPKSLLLKSFSLVAYQIMQYIDTKGRQELLKTSTGDALDNLGALLGMPRNGAKRAVAMERFTLSAIRNEYVSIPAGTRVKTQSGKYFNTLDYAEIPMGSLYVDVEVQAEIAGTGSNGIQPGNIEVLVDANPYVAAVTNITESMGGLDIESDDDYTERIFLSPSRYSSAGPRDAYEYYIKEWRSDIKDVKVVSPSPCVIEIYAVLENGKLLTETERNDLQAYISGENMRPLCDKVLCAVPEEIPYKIGLTYWIASSDKQSAGIIQEQVAEAVEEYKTWQRKLGRDINPTELIMRIRQAGAKRVRVSSPLDITISETQIPACTETTVIYGGIEDD